MELIKEINTKPTFNSWFWFKLVNYEFNTNRYENQVEGFIFLRTLPVQNKSNIKLLDTCYRSLTMHEICNESHWKSANGSIQVDYSQLYSFIKPRKITRRRLTYCYVCCVHWIFTLLAATAADTNSPTDFDKVMKTPPKQTIYRQYYIHPNLI